MQKLGPAVYRVTNTESFSIEVRAIGTGYAVFGAVKGTTLSFTLQAPTVTITPQMLSGSHKTDRIHIRVIYTQGSQPNASYVVVVRDQHGTVVDTLTSHLIAGASLPHPVDFTLFVETV